MILRFYLKAWQRLKGKDEARYRKLLENVKEGLVFSIDGECDLAVFKLRSYCCWQKKRQRFARCARIRRLIFKLRPIIINIYHMLGTARILQKCKVRAFKLHAGMLYYLHRFFILYGNAGYKALPYLK